MAVVGTGSSTKARGADAAGEAARMARGRLRGAAPVFGLVFAAPRHDLAGVMAAVGDVAGGADVVGCSTAGEITEAGLTHGGVAVVLVGGADVVSRGVFARGLRDQHPRAASALCQPVADVRKQATARGLVHATSVLVTDGLAGTGEQLVHEVLERLAVVAQVVGGAAGDEGAFKSTVVGAGSETGPDAAAALHVFSKAPWGVGVGHGLRATTKAMKVTRARDNVVYELDGRPAFEAYKRHAAERGVTLTRDNAGAYLLGNELGVMFFETVKRARAPLFVGDDGSLTCAASVPEGAMVSVLDGDPANLVAAARTAAEEAAAHLGGAAPAGVLLFDCICRGMILKDGFQREIDAVRSVFGDVPVGGFLTYGEIARYRGSLDGWHNATAVVLAIPG